MSEPKGVMPCAAGFDELAGLLRYPDGSLMHRAEAAQRALGGGAAAEQVADFAGEVAHVTESGLEELYTRTFDLNPVATLEVGWHLWGEQYERGRFLSDLRELEDRAGLDAGSELPDHLTILLSLLGRGAGANLVAEVRTALKKIGAPLEEHGNPYRHLIRAADAVLAGVQP